MDTSTTSTPKSRKSKVNNGDETPTRKIIKLPYDPNSLFVPADQLRKIPRKEDDKYSAGDLLWVKSKGFPWWPCLITVDPQSGKYSKTLVIRNKNDKAFHVQFFGSRAYRGYTQGVQNITKYDGKEKYELRLDQIKNTPTSNKSLRKQELNNFEIKNTYKKDWNLACDQADAALELDRATRIETLTFEYILDRPKSTVKKEPIEDVDSKTKLSKTTEKKRKAETQQPTSSKNAKKSSNTQSAKRKKKANVTKSSPADVYDFNEFDDEMEEQATPKKPFTLSSAKRAKGEYSIYAKQLRANIEKENPEMDAEEVEQKLKRNWALMSEDMRNGYAPRSNLFHNQSYELNDADISIPDLDVSLGTNETKSQSKKQKKRTITKKPAAQPKTYSGRKTRKSTNEDETSGEAEEKENAVEEEMETEETAVEENGKEEEEPVVPTNNRSSSRKKLFNQGNETNESVNENKTNNTPKRQSNRTRNEKASVETPKLKSRTPSTKSSVNASSIKSPLEAKTATPSTRSSRRLSAASTNNEASINADTVAEEEQVPEVATTKSNSIKSKNDESNENNQSTTEETNGLNEDSVSCSSESEKAEQQKELNEENKEKTCAKCLDTDKGLIKCEGDCLSHYHKECLHQTS